MPELLCIVDPSLKDFVGHHFEYDSSVAAAYQATGGEAVILAHRDVPATITQITPARAVFTLDMWGIASWARGPLRRLGEICANLSFLRDLRRGLRDCKSDKRLIFAHMVIHRQMLGFGLYALLFLRRQDQLVMLLRYEASLYQTSLATLGFRLIERMARRRSIRFATDSARLAESYSLLTSLPFEVFPIPHTPGHPPADEPRMPGTPLTLVSLGNARDEKGILEIFEAVRLLRRTGDLANFRFVLQVNHAEPHVQAEIDRFAAELPRQCVLIDSALDTAGYRALLMSADVVLIPYWRSIYAARTSGIFFDALSAGKPVIVSRDTWMADQLSEHGAGLLCNDHDAVDLARAICEIRAHHQEFADLAVTRRDAWQAEHSAASLVQALTDGVPARKVASPPQRVAMLYPWGDFGSGQAGASRRVTMLIDYLQDRVPEIRVLQGDGQAPTSYKGIPVDSHIGRRWRPSTVLRELSHRLLILGLTVATLGRSRGQETMLWLHLRPRFDRRFAYRVAALVRWADVVLLEYTFWTPLVMPLARQLGVTVIQTSHDVLSAQVTRSALLHRLTERIERDMLLAVDHRVMVSPRDAEFWRSKGVSSTTIPVTVDLRRFDTSMPLAPEVLARELLDLELPEDTPILLFVGSGFEPNYIAVEHLRQIAAAMPAETQPAPLFVVAGRCAKPERHGNFVALGQVEDIALVTLYRMAALIIVPLPFGTGVSVKTIEAMAAGRPILGTTPAFRALSVTDDVDCVIEDDLAAYPDRIRELLANPARSARLGAAAAAFAQDHDFRTAYRAYLPLMGLPDTPTTIDSVVVERATWVVLAQRAIDRAKPQLATAILRWLLAHQPDDPELLEQLAAVAAANPVPSVAATTEQTTPPLPPFAR